MTGTKAASGRVLYLQYTNPAAYPPLEHSAHILAAAGFDVLMLGTGILGDALAFEPHPKIRVQLRPFQAQGWRQKLHYLSFMAHAGWLAARWRPTWIYASDPLSSPMALLASRLSGARVIYHEHDSPQNEDGSSFLRWVFRARRALARRADFCVLPNEDRAEMFRRLIGGAKVLTVWNCPMRGDVAKSRTGEAPKRLRVLYHGSIVPSRLPIAVVEAVARLPPTVSLLIGGYETAGHAGHVRMLLERAETLGIADRVTFAGTVPRRADLMQQCLTCDVGLALLPADSVDLNERAMVGASNKPFDYLANGLPVLVANIAEWQHTFVDAGFGLACDAASADSIAAALRWFLENPEARRAMGERGRRKIADDWNYQTAFAPVMKAIMGSVRVAPHAVAMTRAGI